MFSSRFLPLLAAFSTAQATPAQDLLQQGRAAVLHYYQQVIAEEQRIAREQELQRLSQICREALNKGDLPLALRCIQAGVPAELLSRQQQTALQIASRFGQVDMVESLLNAGAKTEPGKGISPLLYAVMGGHTACARLLLAAGAEPDTESLVHAIMGRHDEMVTLLLEKGAIPGSKAILKATLAGRADYVRQLLAAGAPVNARGEFPAPAFGTTPKQGTILIAAAERGFTDIVDLLLAAGANINAVGDDGRSALIRSIVNRRLSMAEKLIHAGADVTLRSKAGTTALMAAAYQGNMRLYRLIVSKGGIEADTNHHKETMLMYAAMGGHCELIRHLTAQGADATAIATSGATALHYAIEGGHYEAAKLLLELGASPNRAPRIKGIHDQQLPPLHLAVSRNRQNLAELLLAAGANPREKAYPSESLPETAAAYSSPEIYTWLLPHYGPSDNENNSVNSLLSTAALHGNDAMVRYLVSQGGDVNYNNGHPLKNAAWRAHSSTIRTLIESGADIPRHGADALASAVRAQNRETAHLLMDYGAGANGSSWNKATLHHAAIWGERSVFERLLALSADPKARDSGQRTAVHYAAQHGHTAILNRLAEKGVSLTDTDHRGYSPLYLALENGHVEAARLLCRQGVPFNSLSTQQLSIIWRHCISTANEDMVRYLLSMGLDGTHPCAYTYPAGKTAAQFAADCLKNSDKADSHRKILRMLTGSEEPPAPLEPRVAPPPSKPTTPDTGYVSRESNPFL